MISTELLSLVDANDECCCEYELAHKCKEWAITKGFSVVSTNSYMGDLQPTAQLISSSGCEYTWINGETEQEVIFKVCQWILDNKDKQ